MLGKYGETLVVDWGLAKSSETANRDGTLVQQTKQSTCTGNMMATMTGSVVGTPQFMSPEQASGRLAELGPASDVYSLGATLYYLLVNNAPFAGQPANQILENVSKGLFPKPRQIDRTISRSLEAICLKAMALHPLERYSSSEELAKDIERYLADEPTTAYKESVIGKVFRIARKISLPFAAGFLFYNSFAYCLVCLVATPFYLIKNSFPRSTQDIILMVIFSLAYMGIFGTIGFRLGFLVLKGNVKSLWIAAVLYLIVTSVAIYSMPKLIIAGDADGAAAQFLLLVTSSVGLASVISAIFNRDKSIRI
jgi:serine/threonine protein kinase